MGRPPARWVRPALVALTAVALALTALGTGAVGTASVVSASMAPTYGVGGTLLTTTVGVGEPGRGDVVVFAVPASWRSAARESGVELETGLMVKRVVGRGGDRVVCCAPGGRLVVNGEVLDEGYLARRPQDVTNPTYDVTVPAGHLWLLGDNRRHSFDSRAMQVREPGAGFVPVSAVRARVLGGF
ncbi:signal peptidase I [Nocardioides nitrophenolicus]|uniref:signal peptidase I n=1 Tax=Nocardioides nitrophenolicus TaxID=60489 RepID=UPI00195A978E|nr:signal peptidase I [Nocardioides nitrophenolicus]MBM7516682.1 signal peptidase I [Nocardioides nitrophenolicus]